MGNDSGDLLSEFKPTMNKKPLFYKIPLWVRQPATRQFNHRRRESTKRHVVLGTMNHQRWCTLVNPDRWWIDGNCDENQKTDPKFVDKPTQYVLTSTTKGSQPAVVIKQRWYKGQQPLLAPLTPGLHRKRQKQERRDQML
jgi:hypothetical protein